MLKQRTSVLLLPLRAVAPHVHVWGLLLFHLGRRELNIPVLCGLCIILNLLKDKLLGQSMSIGVTQVLPQRVCATIVVAQAISPGIAPLRGVVVPSMHPGPI